MIANPVTLNDIRDRTRAAAYPSVDAYLDDMRALAANTAAFNTTADVQWVVQHAALLLEAAEDAVAHRRVALDAAAAAVAAAPRGA
eukprot:contig_41669_g9475